MAKNIELKDEITLDEYKAWLTGMLRGKGNQLPDLNDWKAIKKMTDKIIPDVVEVQNPMPYIAPTPYVEPEPLPWWLTQPTCGGTGDIDNANNITITNGSSKIDLDAAGNMDVNSTGKFSIGCSSEPVNFKSPHMHKYDTSKYLIVSTPSGIDPTNHYIESATEKHLAAIAEISGVKK